MPTFEEIYASEDYAADYDALVSAEDYQGNILRTLREITPLAGTVVVEFGAGTGRLTRMLAPHVRAIHAFDRSPQMLAIARRRLELLPQSNWTLDVGENNALPVGDEAADIAIEGWSFGHATEFEPDRWQMAVAEALDEMMRVLRPGGTAILLETLGTGSETPAPPNEALAALYHWWEEVLGFQHRAIRTDYQFESLASADELTRFFFGDEMADRVMRESLLVLPECTGVWWTHKT